LLQIDTLRQQDWRVIHKGKKDEPGECALPIKEFDYTTPIELNWVAKERRLQNLTKISIAAVRDYCLAFKSFSYSL
jgi:hypothetical protein